MGMALLRMKKLHSSRQLFKLFLLNSVSMGESSFKAICLNNMNNFLEILNENESFELK